MDDDITVTAQTITWTHPGEIDGEPDEVRALVCQQLREVGNNIGRLTIDSVTQIRNAGITAAPGREVEEVPLEDWAQSAEGRACRDLIVAARGFVAAVNALA